MITKKNLAIFEINECDFKYFLKGAAKYQFPLIKNYFNLMNIMKNIFYQISINIQTIILETM